METDRLQLLVELERLGSMRAVADELGTTTSRVSHQLSLLSTEMHARLLEPEGRRVRLTAAGRRLAAHARVVLAEIQAAQSEETDSSEPAGTVQVVAFATAIRHALIPAMERLARRHPRVHLTVTEHEPDDARALLLADRADLGLLYDYNLAPLKPDSLLESMPLWTTRWCLGVPEGGSQLHGRTPELISQLRRTSWIGNSRNRADEEVIGLLGSIAGFTPIVAHRCDDLDVVSDLIAAGEGVGLLPASRPAARGVSLVPLDDPVVLLRASASWRAGRTLWPPLRAVLNELHPAGRPEEVEAPAGARRYPQRD